jgi:hypothetical protein
VSIDHVTEIYCDHHNCTERIRFLTGYDAVARDSAQQRAGWHYQDKLDFCPYHAPTRPGIKIPEEVDLGLRDLPAP